MAKPATLKRRNKIQHQNQQHVQQSAHKKDEDIAGLHDEADVMSFRSAATHRFLLNQELIENVIEKWVHTDSIIKPTPFPSIQTKKEDINELRDEVYYGNIKLMKQKVSQLENDVEQINDQDEDNGIKILKSLHESIDHLANAFLNKEEVDYPIIEEKFTELTKKRPVIKRYSIRSIPSLNNDTSEAPQNYWEEVAKSKAAALNVQVPQHIPNQNDLAIPDNFIQTVPGTQNQLPYSQPPFGTEDLNIMDDVGFGLHSTLDDQDFLSHINHSRE